MSINKVQNKPSIYDQSLQNDYFIRRQLDQFASISDCKSLKSSKNSTKGNILYCINSNNIYIIESRTASGRLVLLNSGTHKSLFASKESKPTVSSLLNLQIV